MNHLLKIVTAVLFFSVTYSANAEEIRVGLMMELTGQSASNGIDCRDGIEVARRLSAPNDSIGNYKLQFIYSDTQRDPKIALSEYQKLVKWNRVTALVVNGSPIGMALKPLVEREHIPLLGMVGHSEFLDNSKYIYRFWPSARAESEALGRRARLQGYQSIAIVSTEDEWNMDFRNHFRAAFLAGGGIVQEDATLLKGDREFAPTIAKIRAVDPDAVLVNLGIGQAGLFIRKLRESGYRKALVASYFVRKQSEIDAAGPENINGTNLIELAFDYPFFLTELTALGRKEPPTPVTYACFSTLSTLLTALRSNNDLTSREKLAEALDKVQEVQFPTHALKIRAHEAVYDLQAKVIRDGRVVAESQ